MVTAATWKQIALSMPEAEESAHFEVTDFRVRNKIFATLHPGGKQGTLRLTTETQQIILEAKPEAFAPAAGAWGRRGWTTVTIARVARAECRALISESFVGVAPKKLAAALTAASAPEPAAAGDAWSGANALTLAPGQLEKLRKICLALPDATEKEAWGDPTWRIRDKIFAMQKGNVDGGRPSLWVKGEDGAQEAMVAADPARFFRPPYVGHKGWIGIYLDGGRVPWKAIERFVADSYRLTAPKRGRPRR